MAPEPPLHAEQVKRQVDYWLDLADYDLATARTMLAGGHLLYVGFMCHQVVEKGLKAIYVHVAQSTPPYIHALVKLAKLAHIYDELSPETQALLDVLEPLNIEARYPSQKTALLQSLTPERCRKVISDTEKRIVMDKNEVRRRVEAYARAVAREFPDSEVVWFGSYVTGHPHEFSDIDVAVVLPEIHGDFLALAARLHHLRNDIDPMIEPHLLIRTHDESGFLHEVERTGEVIYRAA